MNKKFLIISLQFLALMIIPLVANAATITSCTFDREAYRQGQTGYLTVRIYNDKDNEIRVTELTATINYFYTDENVYLQKFFTNTTLPAQIQPGQTATFHIPFSLPTNIASGYTNVEVKAITELWDNQSQRWWWSDHPTFQQKLYIESPYKQQSEEQQKANQQLEQQLLEKEAINDQITTMTYIFGATTILFAAVIGFLFVLYRKARIIMHPAA